MSLRVIVDYCTPRIKDLVVLKNQYPEYSENNPVIPWRCPADLTEDAKTATESSCFCHKAGALTHERPNHQATLRSQKSWGIPSKFDQHQNEVPVRPARVN